MSGGSEQAEKRSTPLRTHALFFLASIAVCLLGYRDVVFAGKSFLPVGETWAVYAAPPYASGYHGEAAPPFSSGYDVAAHAWVIQPAAYYERRAILAGTLPLWDPHDGLGRPLLANGQTPLFNPLHWLVLIDPDSPALWDAYFLLLRFVAALFACYLLRELRVPDELCLLGAALAGLNGSFTVHVNRGDVASFAVVPALLFCTLRLRKAPTATVAAGVALSVYCVLTAGHPEPSFGCLLTCGFVALGLLVLRSPGARARFALYYGGAVVTAVLVAAPSWFPMLELIRTAWHTHPQSVGANGRPGFTALQWLLPDVFSPSPQGALFSWPYPTLAFLGVVPGFLTLLGLASCATRLGRARLAWMALPVLIALKVFNLWGTRWLAKLPLISQMKIPEYFPPPVLFVLGVAGIVALAELPVQPRRTRFALLVLPLIAIVELVLLAPRYVPSSLLVVQGWPAKALLAVNLAGAAAILSWAIAAGGRRLGIAAGVCLSVLVGVELASYRQPLSARGNPTAPAPYVTWLQRQRLRQQPFRVMGMGQYFMPNFAMIFGLDDVRVTDAFEPTRYVSFVHRLLQRDLADGWFMTAETSRGFKLPNPMLDLLNVRYLIADLASFPLPVGGVASHSLDQTLYAAGKAAGWSLATYEIGGERLAGVIQQLAENEVSAQILVPKKHPYLAFSLAQDPMIWSKPPGGAAYEVLVGGGKGAVVFSALLDPKGDPRDRRWRRERIDLSRWAGSTIELTLRVRAAGGKEWNWGGWGDLHFQSAGGERLGAAAVGGEADFRLAYSDAEMGGGGVVENLRVWPRAFLASEPLLAKDEPDELSKVESLSGTRAPFAVVGADFPGARWEELCAVGACRARAAPLPVTDVREGINDVSLRFEAPRPEVLVLSDTLVDGWRAWVDGNEQPLFHVNYLFRGVLVPAGKHEVRMVYRPREWTIAFSLSLVGLALAGAALVAARRRRPSVDTAESGHV